MTDLTREELAAWPMELRVAIDAMGAVPREVTRGEAEWVVADAAAWCWQSHFAMQREMYEAWRGNDAPADPAPFGYAAFREALDRQDARDAASLAAQINAPPRMLGLLEQVSLENLLPRYPSRQMTIEQDGPHSFQFDGRVWSDAGSAEPLPITYGLMPWEWDSDRIFREIDAPEVEYQLSAGVPIMTRSPSFSMRLMGVDYGTRSVTVTSDAMTIDAPEPKPRGLDAAAKPSRTRNRVPEKLAQRNVRLDGRRSR